MSPNPDMKDPVCGMDVDPQNPAAIAEYEGHEYLFCSQECKRLFDERPDKYSGEGLSPGIEYPQ